jgi:hypothetical protein
MMDKQIHDALQAKRYFLNDLRPFYFSIRLAVGALKALKDSMSEV